MSKEGTLKKRLFPVFFMLIITLVFISITTIIYTLSKDTIAFNEALRSREAILYAAGIPTPGSGQEIDRIYGERVKEVKDDKGNIQYYRVKGENSKDVKNIVIVTRGPGLWGEITAAIGYDVSGKTISGIEIIDQNETPGLGGRIGENWFKEQFRGKHYPISLVGEGATAGPDEIQAITGASYSSKAIQDIVNRASTEAQGIIK
jgi:Na+-transporting NADH:ubiquinone oxidoreductase subunit C